MNDPNGKGGLRKPSRAEPLQPDLPGRGSERLEEADGGKDDQGREAAKRRKEQGEAALANTRDGYR